MGVGFVQIHLGFKQENANYVAISTKTNPGAATSHAGVFIYKFCASRTVMPAFRTVLSFRRP
jgi:hypothetical protein